MNKAKGSTMVIITPLMAAGLAFLIAATASNIGMESQVAAQQQDDEIYRIQETAMSTASPCGAYRKPSSCSSICATYKK